MDEVQSLTWEGHTWSEWHSLDSATAGRTAKAPYAPGLYRIRCLNRGIIYIGETGSLRRRINDLKSTMRYEKIGRPQNANHVAGGCVLNCCGANAAEVSWLEQAGIDAQGIRERKGIECDLIAAYRRAKGASPACQFAGKVDADILD